MATSLIKLPGSLANALDLTRVKTLVCEPSPILRQGIRLGLNNLGIRAISEATTFLNAHQALNEGDHDLVVLNHEIEGNDSGFFLREIRAGRMGKDPFLVAVMLMPSRDEPKVRSALDSGPDDMLLIPFATDQLMNRVKGLCERRKPFVITHDYIGPDRRSAPRPGATSATQYHVPNPLKAKAQNMPFDRYQKACGEAAQTLAVERIKRLASALEWEGNALLATFRNNSATPETSFRSLSKLDTIAAEMAQRVAKTLRHATDTLDSLQAEAHRLREKPETMTQSDVESLAQIGKRLAATYTAG